MNLFFSDNEMCAMIENSAASRAAADLANNSLNSSDSLSLMTNDGGSNQLVSSLQAEPKFSSDYNMTPSNDLNFSDFGLFPSTTFGDMLQENKWSESSTNAVEAPSKTTPVPSPATVSSNPHTPAAQMFTSFPFSPLVPSPKDSFDSSSSADRMESARLRTLLMTSKRPDGLSDDTSGTKNKHNILKGLLNPDDLASQSADDESTNHSMPPSPNIRQTSNSSCSLNDAPSAQNSSTTSNNNMLLKVCILLIHMKMY